MEVLNYVWAVFNKGVSRVSGMCPEQMVKLSGLGQLLVIELIGIDCTLSTSDFTLAYLGKIEVNNHDNYHCFFVIDGKFSMIAYRCKFSSDKLTRVVSSPGTFVILISK